MPTTYEPIATTTLGSAAASVTFSSIPGTYTDLVLVIAGASSNGSAGYIGTQFNSDTSSSYSTTRLLGDGSSASSDRYSSETLCKSGTMWGSIGTNIFQVMNYSNSVTYKTMLNRDNNAGNRVGATVSLWRSVNAITSVTFTCPDGGGFASNSTFTLYGIKAA